MACTQVYETLSPAPIAAASLGQVYKGRLRSGETVAVKVQRPYVLETVSIDLFVIRHALTSHLHCRHATSVLKELQQLLRRLSGSMHMQR